MTDINVLNDCSSLCFQVTGAVTFHHINRPSAEEKTKTSTSSLGGNLAHQPSHNGYTGKSLILRLNPFCLWRVCVPSVGHTRLYPYLPPLTPSSSIHPSYLLPPPNSAEWHPLPFCLWRVCIPSVGHTRFYPYLPPLTLSLIHI